MTPTEAALLAYLARSAGHVCTRADLLRHVWDWTADDLSAVQTRTVDAHVCTLRKQLPEGASIVTLRGIGYRYLAGKA